MCDAAAAGIGLRARRLESETDRSVDVAAARLAAHARRVQAARAQSAPPFLAFLLPYGNFVLQADVPAAFL